MIITFELNEQEREDLALSIFIEELANSLPAVIGKALNTTAEHMKGVIKRNFSELARARFQVQVVLIFQRMMGERQVFNVTKGMWENGKGENNESVN